MANSPEEKKKDEHAFKDHSERFPLDALLRKHGYQIKARRKDNQAIWERLGIAVPYKDALAAVGKKEVQEALAKEKIYLEKYD